MKPSSPIVWAAFLLVLVSAIARVVQSPVLGVVPQVASAEAVRRPEIGFTSPRALTEHFQKHGHEFNARTEQQYLQMAQTLRDARKGGKILEGVRQDQVLTRFDKVSGAFLACNSDGTIRTFFKPNTGEDYYWRQLKR